MKGRPFRFDGFSFDAKLKYLVGDEVPVDKTGKYSTYLGGSKMVTQDRYYSFKPNSADIDAIKSAKLLKVAGQYSNTGWETKSVDLVGFSAAYEAMCKK